MSNATEPTLFRLRVAYPKVGRLKYLGHLELIHTVEQVVRRAALPYAVTQGFSPHMRIAYTSALPVGTSSAAEYFDVYLTELVPADLVLSRLQDASPADLLPLAAAYVELRRPALTAEITRVDYLIGLAFSGGHSVTEDRLREVFTAWLNSDAGVEIPYRRGKKSKVLSLNRVLKGAQARLSADGRGWVELKTHCDNEGSLRPEILIAALDQALRGLEPGVDEEIVSTGIQELVAIESFQVERSAQWVVDDSGQVSAPLNVAFDAPDSCLSSLARSEVLSNL